MIEDSPHQCLTHVWHKRCWVPFVQRHFRQDVQAANHYLYISICIHGFMYLGHLFVYMDLC